MEDRAHALIAGIFVILFSVAAMLSVWWFSGTRESTRDYFIVTQHNVTGLSAQAQVRYRGIWVGKVQEIKLDPDDRKNILILIRIREDIPVTFGTKAKLSYQGVTGIASILLEDSGNIDTEEKVPDDGLLHRIPMQPSLIEELSESVGTVLEEASLTLHNINALLTHETWAPFASLLARLDTVMTNAETISRNLVDVSATLKKIVSDENSENLNKILANLGSASVEVQPLIDDMRKMAGRLDQAGQRVDEFVVSLSQSKLTTIGNSLHAMTQTISDAAKQLRHTLETLELSPQSLIFGEPRSNPGPGEKGFSAPRVTPLPEGTKDEGL